MDRLILYNRENLDSSRSSPSGYLPMEPFTFRKHKVKVILMAFDLEDCNEIRNMVNLAIILQEMKHDVLFLVCKYDIDNAPSEIKMFPVIKVGRFIPKRYRKSKWMKEIGLVLAAKRIIRDSNISADVVIGDISLAALWTLRRKRIPVILFRDHNLIEQPAITKLAHTMMNCENQPLVNTIIVNNQIEGTGSSGFSEIVYPTVTYKFAHLPLINIKEIFPTLQDATYFVAIGNFRKFSNLSIAMKAFDMLMVQVGSRYKVRLFVISFFDEDQKENAEGFQWLSLEHSQREFKNSIVLVREATMAVKKALITNCLAVIHPEKEVASYDSLLYCLSLAIPTISGDSTCARNIIMHRLTGLLIECKEDLFASWMVRFLDTPDFITYLKYTIQIDFQNRFSEAAFSEHLSQIIYHKVVLYSKVPMIEPKAATYSKLDLIWTLLETNKIGRHGHLSIEQLHEIIKYLLPSEIHDMVFHRINLEEEFIIHEMFLLHTILKQQLMIQVRKLAKIIKYYKMHREFTSEVQYHLIYIGSLIFLPILSDALPTSFCNIEYLQNRVHALDTDFDVHSILVKTFLLLEEVATDFFRVLNKIRFTIKPELNAIIYPSVCVKINSYPVLNEDIREKLKYYVEPMFEPVPENVNELVMF